MAQTDNQMYSLRDLVLIVDDREQKIYPHLPIEATEINYIKRRIAIGDYVLINRVTKQILAVFERKSLVDFGASFKDGRFLNHQNLVNLKKSTGCRIIYILEGPAHPKPTQTFANIPYHGIESCIFHLMMTDNVLTLYTMNTQHTVQKLVRFIKSMVTLMNREPLADITGDYGVLLETNGAAEPSQLVPSGDANQVLFEIPDVLLNRADKNTIDVVRTMWATFRGISVVNADMFIHMLSLRSVIDGTYSNTISQVKHSNGRAISRGVLMSLAAARDGDLEVHKRLLSAVPGISVATAEELLAKHSLIDMITSEPGVIALTKVGKTQRNLGIKKAASIGTYFNFTLNAEAKATGVIVEGASAIADIPIEQYEDCVEQDT